MIIRRVENKTFRNAVVHITGNAYIGCKFYDCTFVFSGLPCSLVSNVFHGNHVWRLEFTVYDPDQWDIFMTDIAPLITKQLPRTPPQSQ